MRRWKGSRPESRFQLAYGAALGWATIAVHAAGYRLQARPGHHQLTFQAAGVALGSPAREHVRFFDLCRRQRNVISYDGSEVSSAQAEELLEEAASFATLVTGWLEREHPALL